MPFSLTVTASRTFPLVRAVALTVVLTAIAGCTTPPPVATTTPVATTQAPNTPASTAQPPTTQALLSSLATQVILPTYQALDAKATALSAAVGTLAKAPTEANLKAARTAWQEARAPWETSESHLIGPVKDQDLDPALDSWPVERNDLEKVLASDVTLDLAFITSQQANLKGFHVMEYVLYTNEAPALTARKLAYLTALTAEFKANTASLLHAWEPSGDNFLAQYTAPTATGAFGTSDVVLAETLHAMAEICEEVANGKIETPLAAKDATQEESHFSGNSLADFRNNIQGVQTMYLGPTGVPQAMGLTHLVAPKDAAVDARVRARLTQALADLDAVPGTFETAITQAPEALRKVQASIQAVRDVLQQDVSKTLTGRVSPDAT